MWNKCNVLELQRAGREVFSESSPVFVCTLHLVQSQSVLFELRVVFYTRRIETAGLEISIRRRSKYESIVLIKAMIYSEAEAQSERGSVSMSGRVRLCTNWPRDLFRAMEYLEARSARFTDAALRLLL